MNWFVTVARLLLSGPFLLGKQERRGGRDMWLWSGNRKALQNGSQGGAALGVALAIGDVGPRIQRRGGQRKKERQSPKRRPGVEERGKGDKDGDSER